MITLSCDLSFFFRSGVALDVIQWRINSIEKQNQIQNITRPILNLKNFTGKKNFQFLLRNLIQKKADEVLELMFLSPLVLKGLFKKEIEELLLNVIECYLQLIYEVGQVR